MGRRVVIIALVAVAVDSLDLDPDHVTYAPLAELATATEKLAATLQRSPSARSRLG
jgi:hypothetical protein